MAMKAAKIWVTKIWERKETHWADSNLLCNFSFFGDLPNQDAEYGGWKEGNSLDFMSVSLDWEDKDWKLRPPRQPALEGQDTWKKAGAEEWDEDFASHFIEVLANLELKHIGRGYQEDKEKAAIKT